MFPAVERRKLYVTPLSKEILPIIGKRSDNPKLSGRSCIVLSPMGASPPGLPPIVGESGDDTTGSSGTSGSEPDSGPEDPCSSIMPATGSSFRIAPSACDTAPPAPKMATEARRLRAAFDAARRSSSSIAFHGSGVSAAGASAEGGSPGSEGDISVCKRVGFCIPAGCFCGVCMQIAAFCIQPDDAGAAGVPACSAGADGAVSARSSGTGASGSRSEGAGTGSSGAGVRRSKTAATQAAAARGMQE